MATGSIALLLAALAGCGSGSSHATGPGTTACTSEATSTSRATSTTALGANPTVVAYCTDQRRADYADGTIIDPSMRPVLTRMVQAVGMQAHDAALAADASALLANIRATVTTGALARVPVAIRADVRALRLEKQAILEHVVAGANGDPGAMQFLVQVQSTGGGMIPHMTAIAAFVRRACPDAP